MNWVKCIQTFPTLRRRAGLYIGSRPDNHKMSLFTHVAVLRKCSIYCGLCSNSKHISKSTRTCRFARSVTHHHALIRMLHYRDWSVKINTGQSQLRRTTCLRKGAERQPKRDKGHLGMFSSARGHLNSEKLVLHYVIGPVRAPNGAWLGWVYKVLIEYKRCRSQGDHL